jgi:trk system potassium uptake protein TrkH
LSPTLRLWRAPLLTLGVTLVALAVLMALAGLFDWSDAENPDGHLEAAFITVFVGAGLLIAFRSTRRSLGRVSLKSAFLVTAVTWLVIPLFAAMPFMMTAEPLSFTDAVFEATSGLTTTGSTVIAGLDDVPRGILLWRSMLQWLGGVGIILVAVVLLPFLRVGGMQLFQLESSDRSGERIIPQAGALILWLLVVNLALNAACAVAYGLAGMSAFDAFNHALTTVATGGYSTHDASLGFYDSPAMRWTATAFMLAGALPFVAYIKAVRGRIADVLADRQIRFFLGGVAVVIAVAQIGRWAALGDASSGTLSHTAFNIVSIVTTTGFATQDYQLWGPGYVALFFALTFLGGCAGSTTGGIKTYRFQILYLVVRDYMRGLVEPNVVRPHRFAGRRLDDEVIHAVLAFIATYVGAVSLGALALGLTGLDLVTALSGAAQAIANVGPGLGPTIGPAGDFAGLPDAAKWVLCALMLLGRLELFALLVLADPRFWRV